MKRLDLVERNKSQWMKEKVRQSKLGKPRPKSIGKAVSKAQKGIRETTQSNQKRREWNLKHKWKPPVNKGEKHPRWKGGIKLDKKGYILVHKPKHPMARKDGFIFQHRLVMAEKLKRILYSYELVHHINHNRIDNRPENLQIVNSNKEHFKIHPNHK